MLPLSGSGEPGCEGGGNCEVMLEGPGMEVTLVATRDIAPGEGLVLCDGGEEEEASDGESEDGERSDGDDGSGGEEARAPKRSKR